MDSITHQIHAGALDDARNAIRERLTAYAAQSVAELRVEIASSMLDPTDDASE